MSLLVDQYGAALRRPRPAPRASSASPQAVSGLYQTPNNTGESNFFRPRRRRLGGLGHLGHALNHFEWLELLDLSRQLIAQMPDLGAAVLQKNQYAVGNGWRPVYQGTKDRKWGEAAMEWIDGIWLPQCSLAGGFFDWNRDLLVSAISWDVDGDDLCLFVIDEDGFPKLAFRPADHVGNGTVASGLRGEDEVKGGPFDGSKICNGIIKDREGRRIGVRVLTEKSLYSRSPSPQPSPPGEGEYTDIPAHQCDLEAEPVWRVQDRGLPRPAPAIMHMLDSQDVETFILRGIKLASSIGLIHYNETGEAPPNSDIYDEQLTPEQIAAGATVEASDIKIEKRLGGEMYYMKAGLGEKLEEVLSKRPSGENMEFLRELKRDAMLAIGWFLELVDPERVSGAPMRAIQDQARHSVCDRQITVFRRAKRCLLFALAQAMETGRIPKNPDPLDWMKWGFGLPALLTVDAGYDRQADREDLILGVTTKTLICQKSGQVSERVDSTRLMETQRVIANARILMEETNAKAKDPLERLELRECIALLQGGSNAPEGLRAQLDKSQDAETKTAEEKRGKGEKGK